jgi:uncharacterized protein YlxW (UPF0749 family)
VNPFVSRITGNSWIVPVSALSLVLGFMMTVAWMNESNRVERLNRIGSDSVQRWVSGNLNVLEENKKITEEVTKLREDNTKLQNAVASQTGSSKVLNEGLQEAKTLAGLTEVEGPGITITLRDSTKPGPPGVASIDAIIHDGDVLRVVNELWAAGAEAISVNKHRVAGRTSFRCVGPVIHVDGVPISSPVVIKAIGDPETLTGGVNIRLGVLDEIRAFDDPNMVEITTFQLARLPAFAGSTKFDYAKVPKDKK